eukprot:3751885-Amphidinium_carterae.1
MPNAQLALLHSAVDWGPWMLCSMHKHFKNDEINELVKMLCLDCLEIERFLQDQTRRQELTSKSVGFCLTLSSMFYSGISLSPCVVARAPDAIIFRWPVLSLDSQVVMERLSFE